MAGGSRTMAAAIMSLERWSRGDFGLIDDAPYAFGAVGVTAMLRRKRGRLRRPCGLSRARGLRGRRSRAVFKVRPEANFGDIARPDACFFLELLVDRQHESMAFGMRQQIAKRDMHRCRPLSDKDV